MKRSRLRGGLRRMVERVGDRLPLAPALALLDRLAPVLPIHRSVLRFPREGLALDEAAARGWQRRARWGEWAGALVSTRIWARGRDALDAVVEPIDFSVAEAARARGQGVLFISAHLNPGTLVGLAIGRRYPDAMFIRWNRSPLMRGLDVRLLQDPIEQRRILVAARAHLRRGGVVHLAPDGGSRDIAPVRVAGRELMLSRAPATLARLSHAVCLPIAPAWRARRLVLQIDGPIAPDAADPAWERTWLDAYGRWLEGLFRDRPEVITFHALLTGPRKLRRPASRSARPVAGATADDQGSAVSESTRATS